MSPASDVYTLGLITHELLTGRLPHGQRVDLRTVPAIEPDRRETIIDREFRYALGIVIATALRKTRGDAYLTAGNQGADLVTIRKMFDAGNGAHPVGSE